MTLGEAQELIRKACESNKPEAIRLAHSLLKNPLLYKDDPVAFCRNILNVNLWNKQQEIANALVNHKKVLVRSCNGMGKSFLAACLAIWFHLTHNPGICLLTAPTFPQVANITFKEIRRLYTGTGIYGKKPHIFDNPLHQVIGFTANDATSFQGHHGTDIFIIFEECMGVEAEFWEAARGMMAGGNCYWLAICNPTDPSKQAYLEEQSGEWHVIGVSALEHPNIQAELRGLPPPIPGAVQLEALRSNIRTWCDPVPQNDLLDTDFTFEGKAWRPGPIADARLLGRYPTQGSYSIFNEYAFQKTLTEQVPEGEVEIGCFVAGTLIDTIQGQVPIQNVRAGDKVLTRQGHQRVKAAGCTGIKQTYILTCEDGITLIGTGNHPIWNGEKWTRLDSLNKNDIIYAWKELNTTALSGAVIQNQKTYGTENTSEDGFLPIAIRKRRATHYTDMCGKSLTAQFRKASAFTTRTGTPPITTSATWNASLARNTVPFTPITYEFKGQVVAKSAARTISTSQYRHVSAQISANVLGAEPTDLTRNNALALSAEHRSCVANTNRPQLVPVRVLTKSRGKREKVYNLTVEYQPEYFANGILVHNCDVARFGDDNTVIHVKQGNSSLFHESYNKRDTKYTADRLKELAIQFAGIEAKKIPIRVDSSGIGGGLCDQREDYNFIEVNSAHKAHDEKLYPNKRSELLFTVADLMKFNQVDFSRLPQHTLREIKRQALGITYKLDTRGRRVAERKDDIKKRIGRSPDDLDAIALAYCGRSPLANLDEFLTGLVEQKISKGDYIKAVKDEQRKLKFNLEDIDDMAAEVFPEYKNVHLLRSFGTYQARPNLTGYEVPLGDYPCQHEAAYSVQCACKLLNINSPHMVNEKWLKPERLKFVEEDTAKRLKERNMMTKKMEVSKEQPKPKKDKV